MKKQQVYIMGNCNVGPIVHVLSNIKAFCNKYEVSCLKPVFMCDENDVSEIQEKVSKADVFITQPIVGEKYKQLGIDTETLQALLPPHAKLIKIPVPYFIGYFPEQFYLHQQDGTLVGVCEGLPHPYHNRIIFYGYCKKLSPSEVLKIINSGKNIENIQKYVSDSVHELERREKDIDIKISKFVQQNYAKKRLFWTINHPTNIVLEHISFEIVKILMGNNFYTGILQWISPSYPKLLSDVKTPIMSSVKKELKLKFKTTEKITEEIIKQYYNYYDKHQELVELNKDELLKVPLCETKT